MRIVLVVLVVVVVGCATPSPSSSSVATPAVLPDRTGAPIAAIPGAPIESLAITADGGAVLTADARSVRLWPALDGTREPVVIAMRPPSMIAIARAGDGFALAGVDVAGHLELVHATRSGEVSRRFDVPLARPIVALLSADRGFVVQRDDSAVSLVSLDGAIRAELATPPGEHLVSLIVAQDRALALVDTGADVRGRWLDLERATWGTGTAALPIDPARAVLSPSRQRLAALRDDRQALAIVELSSGALLATVPDLTGDEQLVGFSAEDDVVLASEGAAWKPYDDELRVAGTSFALAGGVVVGATETNLAIHAEGGTEYLGYRVSAISQLEADARGFLATDGVTLVELDQHFRTRAGHALGEASEAIRDLSVVDAGHALGISYGRRRSLLLISTEERQPELVAEGVEYFAYQPATRSVHYRIGDRYFVARFDARTKRFGAPIGEAADAAPGGPALAAPAGRRAAHGALVAELRDRRITLHAGASLRWSIANPGATGLVFTPDGELVIYGDGVARLDLATGALTERRCGAWFGRWRHAPEASAAASLCEVP